MSAYKKYNALLTSRSAQEVVRKMVSAYGRRHSLPPVMLARLDPRLVEALPPEMKNAPTKKDINQCAILRNSIITLVRALPGPSWSAALASDRNPDAWKIAPSDTPEQHLDQIISRRTTWWTTHREARTPLLDILAAHHRDFAWPTRLPSTKVLVELLTDPSTLAAAPQEARVAVSAYLAQIKASRAQERANLAAERKLRAEERARRREEAAQVARKIKEQRAREEEELLSTGLLPDHDRRSWRRLAEVARLVGLSPSTVRSDLKKGRLSVSDYTRGYMGTETSLHSRADLRLWLRTWRPKIDPSLVEQPTSREVSTRLKVMGTTRWKELSSHPLVQEGYRLVPPQGWPSGIELRLAATASRAQYRCESEPLATLDQLEQEIAWLGQAWAAAIADRARRGHWSPGVIDQVQSFLDTAKAHHEVAWPSGFSETIEAARLNRLISDVLAALVRQHPHLVRALGDVSLSDPLTWYPRARQNPRRWILHLGPTNSGKTHHAMEAMLTAPTGIYLAPLRLMALEGYDRLVAAGKPASLVTGEERLVSIPGVPGPAPQATPDLDPSVAPSPCSAVDDHTANSQGILGQVDGSTQDPVVALPTHVSATIEAGFDEARLFDVAIIDEAQMFADQDRGWAWAQALAGISARDLHVCAAPEARAALLNLAKRLGEPVEIIEHERLTPLSELPTPVRLVDLVKGDALVVFSKRQLMGYRGWLRSKGKSVAVIYGDLGPEVRRVEAERFRSGQADILVSTDAIGMGLNLPIRRLIFADTEKFDGRIRRPLLPSEWKQIAGRAGRHGLYDQGFYGRLDRASAFSKELSARPDVVRFRPPRHLVRTLGAWMGWTSLTEVARFWEKGGSNTEPSSSWGTPGWLSHLAKSGLPLDDQYRYLAAPVDRDTIETLASWVRTHAAGNRVKLPHVPTPVVAAATRKGLANLEILAARIRLYRWCALAFPDVYTEQASGLHVALSTAIAQSLSTMALENLCDACGCRLAVGHPHANCDPCFSATRRQSQQEEGPRASENRPSI